MDAVQPGDPLRELKFAIVASPTPLLLVSPQGRITFINQRLERLFEYGPGELMDRHVEILVPDAARKHHVELRNAFLELPASRSMGSGRDLFGVTKHGKLIPVEIGLDPVDRDGQTWIIASVLDIAERVNAENRIRMALDAVSNAVVKIDESGTIVLANARTCSMFGYTQEQLLGMPLETLVPERYRRRHRVLRTSFFRLEQARRMGVGRELFGLRSDGVEIPVEIALTPIEREDGTLMMCTIMDLTERRQQEVETRARNRQLEMLNAELTQFAYSASHDLKAPLTSIAGLLKFAGQDLEGGDVDEAKVNLAKAQQLASRLAARIEELLAIAKAEDQARTQTNVTLRALIERTWSTLAHEGTTLELDLNHAEPFITSEPMLTSILENLVGNALKFAHPDRPCMVRIASTSHGVNGGRHCTIAVSDNGMGIPTSHHHDVFKMFKRFAPKVAPGSGLGLALVQKYVTVLGGEITFESSPHGTTFTFTLPMQGPQTAEVHHGNI